MLLTVAQWYESLLFLVHSEIYLFLLSQLLHSAELVAMVSEEWVGVVTGVLIKLAETGMIPACTIMYRLYLSYYSI